MNALLEYLDLMLSDINQANTHLQKGFPETLGSPLQYASYFPMHHAVQ